MYNSPFHWTVFVSCTILLLFLVDLLQHLPPWLQQFYVNNVESSSRKICTIEFHLSSKFTVSKVTRASLMTIRLSGAEHSPHVTTLIRLAEWFSSSFIQLVSSSSPYRDRYLINSLSTCSTLLRAYSNLNSVMVRFRRRYFLLSKFIFKLTRGRN